MYARRMVGQRWMVGGILGGWTVGVVPLSDFFLECFHPHIEGSSEGLKSPTRVGIVITPNEIMPRGLSAGGGAFAFTLVYSFCP